MKKNRVNEFNVGGSHRRSPLGGIPIGGGDKVEQGETSVDFDDDKYIFSKRLFLDDSDVQFPMKFPKGLNYAEATKYIKDKFNTGNQIDKDTEMEMLTVLRSAQEQNRESRGLTGPADEMGWGGAIGGTLGAIAGGVGGFFIGGVGAVPGATAGASIGAGIGTGVDQGIASKKAKKRKAELDKTHADRVENANVGSVSGTAGGSEGRLFGMGGPSTSLSGGYSYGDVGDTLAAANAEMPPLSTTESSLYNYTPDTLMSEEFANYNAENEAELYEVSNQIGDENLQKASQASREPLSMNFSSKGNPGDETLSFYEKMKENLGSEGIAGLAMKTGLGLGYNALKLGTLKKADDVPRYALGERRKPNFMNLNETRAALSRERQSLTEVGANMSQGNVGQFMQFASGLHGKSGEALGDTFIKQQQLNNAEALSTDQFNLRQDQLDARNNMFADDLDAKNVAAYDNQRNAYSDAMAQNLINGAETIQNVGQGNVILTEAERNALLRWTDENPEGKSS